MSILNKLITIAFLFSLGVFGQTEELFEHGLDEGKWQDLRKGIRYDKRESGPGKEWTYESKEEYEGEQRKYRGSGGRGEGAAKRETLSKPKKKSADFDLPNFTNLQPLGYLFLGIFVIGIAILIFYLFSNSERRGANIGDLFAITNLNPTEIELTALEKLLKDTLDRGDYRGAIRIYFIFIMRDLANKDAVKWEREKTNMDYLREMSTHPLFENFQLTVRYYEVIWYGKREIDRKRFEDIQPAFTDLLSKLEEIN